MTTYEIEQYEIHTQTYRVETNSEAEAIKNLFEGAATPVDNGLEYIEVAEDFGLSVEGHRDLAEELQDLGVTVGHEVIPSIRSISEVTEPTG